MTGPKEHEGIEGLAEALIGAATEFYARGWMWGTSGNLSVKLANDPLTFAITGSGVDKGELTRAELAVVPVEAQKDVPSLGSSGLKASAESAIHQVLYERLPDVGAVYHVHTVASTLLSRACVSEGDGPWWLEITGFEMLKGWGVAWVEDEIRTKVPVLSNRADMRALAADFRRTLSTEVTAPIILVVGHGMTVWGRTPMEAKNRLEIGEFLCQALWQQRLAQ